MPFSYEMKCIWMHAYKLFSTAFIFSIVKRKVRVCTKIKSAKFSRNILSLIQDNLRGNLRLVEKKSAFEYQKHYFGMWISRFNMSLVSYAQIDFEIRFLTTDANAFSSKHTNPPHFKRMRTEYW